MKEKTCCYNGPCDYKHNKQNRDISESSLNGVLTLGKVPEQKNNSSKACYPRKMWAFLSPSGELLPSTIRERKGDSQSCLEKHGAKYRYLPSDCIEVQVLVDVVES